MRLNFHRIAYEALEVCNAVPMARIDAAVALADISAGARALDIGCGNAAVSVRLAERFGLRVTAVEADPAMAELAADRIAASPSKGAIVLHRGYSDAALAAGSPFDLIVALGTTEPVGGGVRDPGGMLKGLREHLAPGGRLLWGDLVWTAEPPEPLRRIVEMNNLYADDAGWRAAAHAAGLDVLSGQVSSQAEWDAYADRMLDAVQTWIAAHSDHPDAAALTARAGQVRMMMDFGRGFMGFGLYLLAPQG
jgi:SAM-dependent methyltransferase